jgi:hypothetical protein
MVFQNFIGQANFGTRGDGKCRVSNVYQCTIAVSTKGAFIVISWRICNFAGTDFCREQIIKKGSPIKGVRSLDLTKRFVIKINVNFKELTPYLSRFLDLQKNHEVLVLSDREGLPRWLESSGVDSWERGNRWVMKMALTSGADRITLIALWDGKEAGDAPGGTAHMVLLAEQAGKVHIQRIDSMQLVR